LLAKSEFVDRDDAFFAFRDQDGRIAGQFFEAERGQQSGRVAINPLILTDAMGRTKCAEVVVMASLASAS
jgi:hypothetical protein